MFSVNKIRFISFGAERRAWHKIDGAYGMYRNLPKSFDNVQTKSLSGQGKQNSCWVSYLGLKLTKKWFNLLLKKLTKDIFNTKLTTPYIIQFSLSPNFTPFYDSSLDHSPQILSTLLIC